MMAEIGRRGDGGVGVRTEVGALDAVRGQRRSLRYALDAVERTAAAPASGRGRAWAAGLADSMEELQATWDLHIAVTERPGGLFEEVLSVAPRLDNLVRRFRQEHVAVGADIHRELERLRDGADGEPDVEGLRRRVTRLLGRIIRHRQQGADLVYEAYAVDIGGES
jgi:hypothetical protein